MKSSSALVALITLLLVAPVASAEWVPPVGVPAPSFGIAELAPVPPNPWVVASTGFYYVDATASNATDSTNPNGSPRNPRKTIPLSLPAGAYVEVHGTYSFAHSSPRGIVSNGTATAPVFIRGVSITARPVVTSCWEMSGRYFIVENMEFAGCGGLALLAPIDHAALRHSDVHGSLTSGGVGVLSWNGRTASDVVLWDNVIHDNGDVHATYDQDNHGIAIGANVHHVWVVDSEMYRNSGDGIQINAGSVAAQPTTHHIYVGRNRSHDNKQNGFWTKQAVDVIFSQNLSYRHRPSNSSMGVCMGGQYAPDFVWFLNNMMWDCDYGIQLASDDNQGIGTTAFFIGNVIIRIHDSDGSFQAGSGWQNCGISLPGGVSRYVMENSLYDVDSGLCAPYGSGSLYVFDNLIEGVRPDGWHIFVESPSMASSAKTGGNLFAPNYRLNSGGKPTVIAPSKKGGVGSNGVVASIEWVNPAAGDVTPRSTSPAVGYGTMDKLGIREAFDARYSVPMSFDINGRSRLGSVVSSGAVEP